MKVAFVTDDGKTIGEHFGRARYFRVITIEDGQITNSEMREKPFHHIGDEDARQYDTGAQEANVEHLHQQQEHHHGLGPEAGQRREKMVAVIADCTVVVSRGMGRPMYEALQAANVRPIMTDMPNIDEALQMFSEGTLTNLQERIH